MKPNQQPAFFTYGEIIKSKTIENFWYANPEEKNDVQMEIPKFEVLYQQSTEDSLLFNGALVLSENVQIY